MATISPYIGDGVTRQFDLTFTYRTTDSIGVRVGGVDVAFTFVSSSRIETTIPPESGSLVEVYRKTPVTEPEAVFQDGQILRGGDLNGAVGQVLNRAEELGSEMESLREASVRVIPGEAPVILPGAAGRAGKALYFDNAGAARAMELEELGVPAAASLLGYDVNLTKADESPNVFHIFETIDAGRRARQLHRPGSRGSHVGELYAGFGIEFRPTGSGANGPQNADVGFVVSAIKPEQAVGEMDGGYIVLQQKGLNSDVAGTLFDISRKGGTGFSCQHEGVTKDVDPATGTITRAVRNQVGVLDTVTGDSIGWYTNAQVGVVKYGILLRSDPGLFDNFITCIFGPSSFPTFNVARDGEVTVRKGGLLDGVGNAQVISEHYAATGGGGGGGGNTLRVVEEFRHYVSPVDWQTSENRRRLSVDGSTDSATSVWYSLRGRSGATSSFAIGFGYSGSATFEVRNTGHIKSALLPSLNYANDAAAATGGVAIGELYHTSGTVKVRLV